MRVSSARLAVELVRRLNEVLPATARVQAEGDLVHIFLDGDWDTTSAILDIVEDEERDFDERVTCAVSAVLQSVQSSIIEPQHEPWGEQRSWPASDPRVMNDARARVDGEVVRLWYGDEDAPVLALPPIPLASIAHDGEARA